MPVYFIQAGKSGPIKIGWALDTGARLKILQCAHHEELFLLREVSGERAEESWFHRRFKDKRIRGEWFNFTKEMTTILPPKDLPIMIQVPNISSTALALVNKCVDRLGGRSGTATLCSITEDAVSKWAKIGIPTKHWPTIVAATQAEISYEFLANLRRARLKKSAA